MTDITSSKPLSHQQIQDLFQNGKCLTFNWGFCRDVVMTLQPSILKKLRHHYFVIASKTAIWRTENHHFHYFDNGVLLYSPFAHEKEIEQFKQLLLKNGHKIKEMHQMLGADYSHIENYAYQQYNKKDAYLKCCVETDKEINDLFKNGNICVTASKENVSAPKWRKQFALFSDGRLFECCHNNLNPENFTLFKKEHQQWVMLTRQNITPETMKKIYQKAAEYDWYASEDEAQKKYDSQNKCHYLTPQQQLYIDNLVKNNYCLTVDGGKTIVEKGLNHFLISHYASPDYYKYALFADGRLIVASPLPGIAPNVQGKILTNRLSELYPDMSFSIEWKEDFVIDGIYKALLKTQPSANHIYLNMIKEMAKKLKRKLNITHHEALELCAHIKEYNSWHELTLIDEMQARYLIRELKTNKYAASIHNTDWVEYLYQSYLKKLNK